MLLKNIITIPESVFNLSSYSTSKDISVAVGGISGFQELISQCIDSAVVGISLKDGGSIPATVRINNLSKTTQKLTFEWFLDSASTSLSIYLSGSKFIVRKKTTLVTSDLGSLDARLSAVEGSVGSETAKVEANKAAIEVLNGTEEGSVSKQISDSKAEILGEVSEEFNTLEKIEGKFTELNNNAITEIKSGDNVNVVKNEDGSVTISALGGSAGVSDIDDKASLDSTTKTYSVKKIVETIKSTDIDAGTYTN